MRNRGPSARLAPQGLIQLIGGDARRRRKTERGGFSASLLSRKAPRSVLGGVSRPRRPRSRGKSVGNAKHTSTADGHTLKGDRPRRARGQARHNGGTLNATRSAGRGWEFQGQSLEERERTNQRRAGERGRAIVGKPRRALQRRPAAPRRGATAIQPPSWDDSRTSPSARIAEL